MKTHLTVLMLLVASLQTMAQCRLVRVESSDSSSTKYYSYDKLGRLISYKNIYTLENQTTESKFQYAYDNNGKVISVQQSINDKLSRLTHFIYDNGIMIKLYSIEMRDTPLLQVGNLNYNDKQQLIHSFTRKSTNDTASFNYEYASEGWLKRMTVHWRTGGFISEYSWNSEEKINDDPERIFFAGYPLRLLSPIIMPTASLSIKGNARGSTLYTIDKDGKETKTHQGEVFDVRANAEGLWLSNKYKDYDFADNKETITTIRAVYEGCKN